MNSFKVLLRSNSLLLPVFVLCCQVAFFLFLSLSVYTVLPLSMAWALMVGIWTSVSHIVIISVYVPVTSPDTPNVVVQVRFGLFKYIHAV